MRYTANIYSSNRSEMIALQSEKMVLFRLNYKVKSSFLNKLLKRFKPQLDNDFSKIIIYSLDYIKEQICKHFRISEEDFDSRNRKREFSQARQLCMYFGRELTKNSLSVIGKAYGNRDHATCLHSIKTVNNLRDTDKTFRSQFEEIELMLNKSNN